MSLLKRMGFGALGGAVLGVLFLGLGLIRALFALVTGHHVSFDGLWPELAWYVGGFALAGVLGGLLWSLRGTRVGRFTIAIVGAAAVVGALFVPDEGAPWRWHTDTVVMWLTFTVVFGLAGGFGLERGRRRANEMRP